MPEEFKDIIKSEVEKKCQYCGESRGHFGSCPEVTKNYGLEKEKKDYQVETTRYSGDIIKEHVVKYDDSLEGYIVDKIEFTDRKNDSLVFSDFLPGGIKLVRSKYGYGRTDVRFLFDPEKKAIYYCNLGEKGNLFSLLHEMGHAKHFVMTGKTRKHNIDEIYHRRFFRNYFIGKIAGEVSENERAAWANALKIARSIQKRGIVLEPEFDLTKDIKENLSIYGNRIEEAAKQPLDDKFKKKFKME